MDVIKFYTGQGVTCDLFSVGLYTGQFTSCSPIIFYNHNDDRGGMYHLPGRCGQDKDFEEDLGTIEEMMDDIDPTWIGLFPTGYGDPDIFATASLYSFSRPQDKDIIGDRDNLKLKLESLMEKRMANYVVEVHPEGRAGIFVRRGLDGLQFATIYPDEVTLVDVATHRNNLPRGCKLYNPEIKYDLWVKE